MWALALVTVVVLAVAVSVSAYRAFNAATSGDYAAHLDYLRYIESHKSLPAADQGFEMYHPPVYYVTSVALHLLVHAFSRGFTLTDAGRSVATTAWVLEGAVAAGVLFRLGVDRLGQVTAAAVVWLLPGQVNVATRLYPETLAGLGVGMMLLGAVELGPETRRGYVWLGFGVPIAALSKYSGLVGVALVVPLVLWSQRRRLRPLLVALGPGSILVGAFYVRNLIRFGTPTPLNSDLFHWRAAAGCSLIFLRVLHDLLARPLRCCSLLLRRGLEVVVGD